MILYLLVSDHSRDAKVLVSEGRLFDFPIECFSSLLPSLYADQVLCAASWAALPPPYTIRVAQKTKLTKPYTSAWNVFFYATSPQKLSSRAGESSIFMFFHNSRQKMWKKYANEYCLNWALVRTRVRCLQFWGARKWASKSTLNAKVTPTFFLRWEKISQKIQKD